MNRSAEVMANFVDSLQLGTTRFMVLPQCVKQTMWEVTRGVAVPTGAQLFYICFSSRVGARHLVACQLPKKKGKNHHQVFDPNP